MSKKLDNKLLKELILETMQEIRYSDGRSKATSKSVVNKLAKAGIATRPESVRRELMQLIAGLNLNNPEDVDMIIQMMDAAQENIEKEYGLEESHSKKHEEELEIIVGELEKASQMHASQAERIQKILDETDDDELKEENVTENMNCGCGNDPCKTFGKNNEKLTVYINEEFENYMEESLYYGLIEEEEAPTDEQLKNMSPVAAISTLMHHNRSGNDEEDFDAAKDELLGRGVFTIEQLQTVKFGDIPDHTGDITNVGTLEEKKKKKKKKKGCKPSKGKKYARRVKGKCVSYGAKGYKIAPGTSKGNSYCARSYGDMKSHGKDCSGKDRSTPLCLSRKKWKCSGKYSRKGK